MPYLFIAMIIATIAFFIIRAAKKKKNSTPHDGSPSDSKPDKQESNMKQPVQGEEKQGDGPEKYR